MASEYSLVISTDLAPIRALHIVSKGLGLKWEDSNTYLVGLGVLVGATSQGGLGQSVIEEAFGFRPDISVLFRINPKEDHEKGRHTLLRATMELLRQIPGDAVLLFNGENIILQRIEGQLVLNEEWGNWTASQLTEVTLPYELCNLPSPLL